MWQLVAAAPAFAYEDQLTLSAGLGYAYLSASERPSHGAAIALESTWGLNPSWSLGGFLGYSVHPGESTHSKLALAAELLYLFDVLAFVPYAGAGLDALTGFPARGRDVRIDLGLHPLIGVDWLVSRDFTLGLTARSVFVVTDWQREPVYLTVLLKASLVYDL